MNRHKLSCPPKYEPFALFNYSSLHYNCILHCLCLVHLQKLIYQTKQVLACRTGIIFSCITGKQRQSWSEQEVPHARWGKNIFFYALPCHTCLVFLTRLKSENKRHFMQATSRKQKVQINLTVSILARELTVFFHYRLKLKSQPFSVFDQVFLTF